MMTTVVHYIYALINRNKKKMVFFFRKAVSFYILYKRLLIQKVKKGVDLHSKYMITDVKYIFR